MASPWRIQAMKERHICIAVVCASKGYVVFDNGVKLPIIGWLDDDHKPTEDPEQYSYYEFGTEEFGYGTGDYDFYSMPSYEDH
jgi:hypothetical protein